MHQQGCWLLTWRAGFSQHQEMLYDNPS